MTDYAVCKDCIVVHVDRIIKKNTTMLVEWHLPAVGASTGTAF
jgi:hypothetical protein